MTFLECGAYNKAWHPVHMFPKETVQAHLDLGGAVLHPIHWATFNLALHPWYEPMERLTAAAEKAGRRITRAHIGPAPISSGLLSVGTYHSVDLFCPRAHENRNKCKVRNNNTRYTILRLKLSRKR